MNTIDSLVSNTIHIQLLVTNGSTVFMSQYTR